MKGCFSLIVIILALSMIIKFPLFFLGVILIWWGIHEYIINKQLKAKSKLIPMIITLGCILSISGCALTLSNDAEKDHAETSKNELENIENEKQTISDSTSIKNTVDSSASTPEKEEELKSTPQVEKEEVKEEPVVNNTPEQETESSPNSNMNSSKEISETDSSSNTQEGIVNNVTLQKEYYQNCTELRKVYPSGVPSDHPAYAPKHDRDKDGWACEK